MKISIVHPSRNRVKMATEAVKQWKKAGVEYILSVDYSDTAENYIGYQELAKKNKLNSNLDQFQNRVVLHIHIFSHSKYSTFILLKHTQHGFDFSQRHYIYKNIRWWSPVSHN